MSVLRGKFLDPALEQRPAVVRARAGLGMELHGARIQLGEVEPLDVPSYREIAVASESSSGVTANPWFCEVTSTRPDVALEHRMVGAAVAERQLERLVPGREAEQLVAEADPEDGRTAEEVTDDRGLLDKRVGIAGAVREDDTVVAASVSASTVCG
jgi:hypothetical protein